MEFLVAGAIAVVAYAAPLPGEDLPRGTAYAFPLRLLPGLAPFDVEAASARISRRFAPRRACCCPAIGSRRSLTTSQRPPSRPWSVSPEGTRIELGTERGQASGTGGGAESASRFARRSSIS